MNCNPHVIESEIGHNLYRALVAKYTAEIVQARSTLMIYFTNPVGIGEHPQHLEEMDKLVDVIATNQDKIENLERHFCV